MFKFFDNCNPTVFALTIGLIFSLFINFCNMVYCINEIEILKEYHNNICSECGQAK